MCCKVTYYGQIVLAIGSLIALGIACSLPADEKDPGKAAEKKEAAAKEEAGEEKGKEAPKSEVGKPDANGLVKMSKESSIWLDTKRKAVVVDGEVCLREGQLEMFACPKGTKEHESVVALHCTAEEVHAVLLATGAKAGTPVKFDPKYEPATGDIVDIWVLWLDEKGEKHKVRAQEWIKENKTEKEMPYNWVFAGSGFWIDETTGKKHYQANAGDLICVSNFATATLDLPVESSQANASLMFVAFTDRIPPRGTKIRVVLIPRLKKEGAEKAGGEKAGAEKEAAPAKESEK